MWFVCVFLKSRAHKQPWKGPLYSAQPAEMRFNGLGLLSCPFHKKKLKYRKKAGGGGLRARRVPNPNDAISLGARLGWKRLGERLKWFKRCRRGLPSKSCLEWEEGGKKGDAGAEWEGKKKKCQAKSSLHSMQNCSQLRECGRCLKQRTRNILWSRDGWGSMCHGGAWGREVHQTSHAALRRERLPMLSSLGRGILLGGPSTHIYHKTSSSAWQGRYVPLAQVEYQD